MNIRSFIIDTADKNFINDNVFTKQQLKETDGHGQLDIPDIDDEMVDLFMLFDDVESCAGLRKALFDNVTNWYNEYEEIKHNEMDLIIRNDEDVELAEGEEKKNSENTDIMLDRELKCPKCMKDALWQLSNRVKFGELHK